MCRRKWISLCRTRADAQQRMARNTIAFHSLRRRHVQAKRERETERLCHCELCISVWSGLEKSRIYCCVLRLCSLLLRARTSFEILSHESSRNRKNAVFDSLVGRPMMKCASSSSYYLFSSFFYFVRLFVAVSECQLCKQNVQASKRSLVCMPSIRKHVNSVAPRKIRWPVPPFEQ